MSTPQGNEREGTEVRDATPTPQTGSHLQETGDAWRLNHLQELIRNCPHAQITFCDDPNCEGGAVGFMIRVEGCETSESCGLTLRDAIDKDIMQHGTVKISPVPDAPQAATATVLTPEANRKSIESPNRAVNGKSDETDSHEPRERQQGSGVTAGETASPDLGMVIAGKEELWKAWTELLSGFGLCIGALKCLCHQVTPDIREKIEAVLAVAATVTTLPPVINSSLPKQMTAEGKI